MAEPLASCPPWAQARPTWATSAKVHQPDKHLALIPEALGAPGTAQRSVSGSPHSSWELWGRSQPL